MTSERQAEIAARFGRSAAIYDRHASLQARIARRLASCLPIFEQPKVLEIGCGTGLFTQHLLRRYQHGDFLITDIAPAMVEACCQRFEKRNGRAVRFGVMDGEAPVSGGGDIGDFDLIAMAMTLQWFADPIAGLERLRGLLAPGGTLLFATIGPRGFPEWRSALAEEGLPDGLVPMPDLPGLVREEWPMVDYGTALSFLERLRGIGATTPRPGYAPISAGGLRRALRRLDREFGACVTWHIVYGRLEA